MAITNIQFKGTAICAFVHNWIGYFINHYKLQAFMFGRNWSFRRGINTTSARITCFVFIQFLHWQGLKGANFIHFITCLWGPHVTVKSRFVWIYVHLCIYAWKQVKFVVNVHLFLFLSSFPPPLCLRNCYCCFSLFAQLTKDIKYLKKKALF